MMRNISTVIILLILQIGFQVVQPLTLNLNLGKDGLQRKLFIETENKRNWFGAVLECTRKNMSLIAIDTAEKSAALDAVLQTQFGEIFPKLWIGGEDLGQEGRFVWVSTGNPFTYTNWKKGMPDNYNMKEHCVHLSHERQWNDIKCGFKFGYICDESK